MKRLGSVLLPVALVVTALAGCGQTAAPASGPETPVATTGSPSIPAADVSPVPAAPGPPPDPMPTPAPSATSVPLGGTVRTVKTGDVTMTALMAVGASTYPPGSAVRRAAGLAVDYTLVNVGRRSLAAYDRVPDDLGSAALGQVNPEHAWVYMSGPVLRVSKQGFDTAPNVRFAAAPVTGIRPLRAGATLEGRAWVPLPPTLDVPGKSFVTPGGKALAPDLLTWQFCVQVGDLAERTGPVTDAVPNSADSDPAGGEVRPAPASAPEPGELICTDPVLLVTP